MRGTSPLRSLLIALACLVVLAICGVVGLRLLFDRTREFRAKAETGQPIVRAIEGYRKDNGNYPQSLADLAPKYLATVPKTANYPQNYDGWYYAPTTNGSFISYKLAYYMGRGGIEYEPPNWFGNDEGAKKLLLSNKR